MNKSSAQDQTPGGFEGRAGGSKGNPTPTALYPALGYQAALSRCRAEVDWFARQHPDFIQYSDRMTELIRKRDYTLQHAYNAVKRRALFA
jgi:hypothetical protein